MRKGREGKGGEEEGMGEGGRGEEGRSAREKVGEGRGKGKEGRGPKKREHALTFMPLVSSSSKFPMSNASAAFTSPLGGTSGGFT